jgi:hypothetical protein
MALRSGNYRTEEPEHPQNRRPRHPALSAPKCQVHAPRTCGAPSIHRREARKAGSRTRTDDRLITNQVLYQLSYAGNWR